MKETERPQYITQLNAFHRWLISHHLSANAILLWFMLIGLFNASDWCEWAMIDNLQLMRLIRTSADKSAYRARKELVDAGLLAYEPGRKGRPGRYRMIWFTDSAQDCADQNDHQNDHLNDHQNDNLNDYQNDNLNDYQNDNLNDGENGRNVTEDLSAKHTLYTRKEEDKEENREAYPRVPAHLAQEWRAFADMRKKMRKPLTGSASALILRRLDTLAPDRPDEQKRILEQSVLNGWAGVYPIKTEQAPEVPASYDIGEFERKLLYGKIEYKKREPSRKAVQQGEIDQTQDIRY